MKTQQNNVLNLSNYKQPAAEQKTEVVYMPYVVYYPVYMTPTEKNELAEKVQQQVNKHNPSIKKDIIKKDNVVSMYDYLGEI